MRINSLADLLSAHLVNYKPNIWWKNHFEVECSRACRHICELDYHAKQFYGREAGVGYTVEETYNDAVAGAVLRINFSPRINKKYDIECSMTPETITIPAVGKGSPFVFWADDPESEDSLRFLSELSSNAFRFFVDASGLKPIHN
jgi:hypothetical protein